MVRVSSWIVVWLINECTIHEITLSKTTRAR